MWKSPEDSCRKSAAGTANGECALQSHRGGSRIPKKSAAISRCLLPRAVACAARAEINCSVPAVNPSGAKLESSGGVLPFGELKELPTVTNLRVTLTKPLASAISRQAAFSSTMRFASTPVDTPAPAAFVAAPSLFLRVRRPRFCAWPCRLERTVPLRPRPRAAHIPRRAYMVSVQVEDASSAGGPQNAPKPVPPSENWALRTVALAALVGLAALARRSNVTAALSSLIALATELGPSRGAALLAGVNFCTVLCCFPANMGLMIGAGAVLGAVPAFAALFVSKIAAAMVAFALARSVLAARVNRWLGRYPKMSRVLTESGREGGWKFIVLMRLSPFPGFLLNYLLSLTGVSFGEYVLGTLIGIAPSILNLVLMGSTAKDVSVGVAGGGLQGGWIGLAFKVLCMLSMVVVSVIITRKAREAFASMDGEGHLQNVEEEATAGR